ncbi:MAG: phage major capsid protein [Ottowia sp.]
MKLNDLREARALKVTEARALLDGNKELTAEQQTRFDALKAEITKIEADEARATFLEDAERRAAGAPVDKPRAAMESGVNVLDAIRAQVENRSATGALAEFQQEAKRQGLEPKKGGLLVPASIFEKRTTQTTTTADKIVPDDYKASEFIGLLRNSLIVRSLGARVLSGLRGDVVIPKQTGASTAYWLAEGDSLTESNPTFDTIGMSPKHVGALSSLSRQLIQQSNPAIEQLVRDDFVQVVSAAVDKALIHGTAAAKQPVGILAAASVQVGNLATLSWANLLGLLEKLALVNASPNAALIHPKVATKLASTLKDATVGAEYLLNAGRVAGIPAHVTNQLSDTGGATPKGRLILGDFTQLVIGEWGATEILANPYATGYYEAGAVQLRILHTLDAAVRNPQAFVKVEDITI